MEEIIKRNSNEPNKIDINNEVTHYFIFDDISDPADLEQAWSLFSENKEIRKRLAFIEQQADSIPGWGYRIPSNKEKFRCEESDLVSWVEAHVKNVRPIILSEDYNKEICDFIDGGFNVEIAPENEVIPDIRNNELFLTLYEALQEFKIEHFPYEKEHYEVLLNWAIYLTKCDEIAAYLLWPCFNNTENFSSDMFEYAAKIWKVGCRGKYWVKDLNYSLKTIYCRL